MRVLAYPGFGVGDRNPYTRLLYENISKQAAEVQDFTVASAFLGRYDIVHIHWPEYYVTHKNPIAAILGSLGFLFLIYWCRLRGAKVIWTVHNLRSHVHKRPRSERLFWKAFTRLLDGYIALTEGGRNVVREAFPLLRLIPGFVVPHGHYRSAYPRNANQCEARRHLGISASSRVVLFFGTVANYKNVPSLVRAFRQLEMSDAILSIVGACPFRKELVGLQSEIADDPRITLRIGFVPTEDVCVHFSASDLVVLPFSEILNSGTALLALSFDRPILVPAKGAMPELQKLVGNEWVRTYQDELTSNELRQALDWAAHNERGNAAPLHAVTWEKIGLSTLRAYQAVLSVCQTSKRGI